MDSIVDTVVQNEPDFDVVKTSSFHVLREMQATTDFNDKWFKYSIAFILFNPIFWNIVARLEYTTHFLTKLAGGSAKRGCYLLAFIIFTLGIGRDLTFERALSNQQTFAPLLNNKYIVAAAYACIAWGQIFVITSMYQLGVTGTYLGDYFGILMDHRVTSFPFNVSNNPMYQGSTLTFLGTSLLYGKPAGFVITVIVYIMYAIALRFEEPFTTMIYSKKNENNTKKVN